MKKQTIVSMIFLAMIFLVSQVYASGVVSPYWPSNPNKVAPGSEGVVAMTIQNMVGEEDLIFKTVIIRNDENIASLDEEEYDVPAGTSDTQVLLHYAIPEDAQVGTTYTVVVSFETVTSGEGGGVAMGTGMDMNIPFEVVAQTEPAQSPTISKGLGVSAYLAILTAIFIIVVLVILVAKRKKRAISFDMPLR